MYENETNAAAKQLGAVGMGLVGANVGQQAKITVRENIQRQIDLAKTEVERLEGVRDRLAPELLDQRIVDLQQAMRF